MHTLVPPGVRFKQCAAQAQPVAEALCSVRGESFWGGPTALVTCGLQKLRGVAGHMQEAALQVCSPRLSCGWCIVWFQGYQTLLL